MRIRFILIFALIAAVAISWVGAFMLYDAADLAERAGPIDPRKFDSLTLVTAGTGSVRENPNRLGPVMAVGWGEQVVLVDAGRATTAALRKSSIAMDQPDLVLLTNLLPRNTVGLADLLYTGWIEGREKPLRVLGPPGTRVFVENLVAAYREGASGLDRALALPSGGDQVEVKEVDGGYHEELTGVTIRAASLTGGPLPALAWRFERGRRTIVISGTGWGVDQLVEFSRGVDLLVHEAVFVPPPSDVEDFGVLVDPERLKREAELHTSILQVGKMAKRAGVRGLVLVRMIPPPFYDFQIESVIGGDYDGKLFLPEDGQSIRP